MDSNSLTKAAKACSPVAVDSFELFVVGSFVTLVLCVLILLLLLLPSCYFFVIKVLYWKVSDGTVAIAFLSGVPYPERL